MYERDIRQLENENSLVQNAQMGPPRRMPDKFEISATHHRLEQKSKLKSHVDELQHSIDVAEGKKRDKESQMLSLTQKIAVTGEKLRNSENFANSVNNGMGKLPIVIGRNISKIHGNGQTAKPKDYFNAVVQQSKLVSFKEIEKDALKAHAGRVSIDRDLWLSRQIDGELQLELQQTFNNLSEIQGRMKDSFYSSLKLTLVEALKSFMNSGVKLASKNVRCVGILQWWKYRNQKLSSNVASFFGGNAMGGISFEDDVDESGGEDNTGVMLNDEFEGVVFGLIKMPKMGLWNIVISVTRATQNIAADETEPPDEHDYCTVRLGPSFASLQQIDRYYNRVNPETGAVLYDIKFLLRGDKLAFKFDFSSSTTNCKYHMGVCTGSYEEYTMESLEYISDPKSSRDKVLSSHVKMIRVEDMQGKNRLTKLLEELIAVEEYKGEYWDSEILQKTSQRYETGFFLRILKAEVLSELHKTQKDKDLIQADSEQYVDKDEDPAVVDKRLRLESSEKAYKDRKRGNQGWIIDKAMKSVGVFLELYDEPTDKWLLTYVKDCQVDWIENGTR
jgi:hypothetical protein